MKHTDLMDLWRQSLDSPHGIEVHTDDRKLLQQQLYRARAAEPTEAFDNLSITMTTDTSSLWIVTKGDINGSA